jgi:hypothetical protein
MNLSEVNSYDENIISEYALKDILTKKVSHNCILVNVRTDYDK